jgi:hypothetical protein
MVNNTQKRNEFLAARTEYLNALTENGLEFLTGMVQAKADELREHLPKDLLGYVFQCYVPGFNDGDPCTFSMCTYAVMEREAEPEEERDHEDLAQDIVEAGITEFCEIDDYLTYALREQPEAHQAVKDLETFFGTLESDFEMAGICHQQVYIPLTGDPIDLGDYDCGY